MINKMLNRRKDFMINIELTNRISINQERIDDYIKFKDL
jgi:hypothetical protein